MKNPDTDKRYSSNRKCSTNHKNSGMHPSCTFKTEEHTHKKITSLSVNIHPISKHAINNGTEADLLLSPPLLRSGYD